MSSSKELTPFLRFAALKLGLNAHQVSKKTIHALKIMLMERGHGKDLNSLTDDNKIDNNEIDDDVTESYQSDETNDKSVIECEGSPDAPLDNNNNNNNNNNNGDDETNSIMILTNPLPSINETELCLYTQQLHGDLLVVEQLHRDQAKLLLKMQTDIDYNANDCAAFASSMRRDSVRIDSIKKELQHSVRLYRDYITRRSYKDEMLIKSTHDTEWRTYCEQQRILRNQQLVMMIEICSQHSLFD